MNVEKKCGSQKKYFLASFWQSVNIVNIMGGFGRYDHVTKKLIVFGHKSISGNLKSSYFFAMLGANCFIYGCATSRKHSEVCIFEILAETDEF